MCGGVFFCIIFFLFALLGIREVKVPCYLWSTMKTLVSILLSYCIWMGILFFFSMNYFPEKIVTCFLFCGSSPLLPLFTHLWGVGRKQSFSFTDMNQSISFCLIHLQGFLFVYLKSVWFICCIAHGIVGRCLSAAFTCLTPTVNCILYDHSAFPFSWITCCTVQNSAESQVNWRVTIMK